MSVMARDLARYFDPVLLARDCGIEPDDWQAKQLRERPKRCLMLCSRQSGNNSAPTGRFWVKGFKDRL